MSLFSIRNYTVYFLLLFLSNFLVLLVYLYLLDTTVENCEWEKEILKRRLSESLIEVERQVGEKYLGVD